MLSALPLPRTFAAICLSAGTVTGCAAFALVFWTVPLSLLGPAFPSAVAAAAPAAAHLATGLLALGFATLFVARLTPALALAVRRRGDTLARLTPSGAVPWTAAALACIVALATFDLPLFVAASFRLDDFEFLRANAEESGVAWLLRTHGGHAYALFRVEWSILTAVFGPSATAFSVANFLALAGTLLAGCWLLAEMGVGALGLAAFILLNAVWPGWAEFTSGYFTLSAYYQGFGLGCCALACVLRAARTGNARWSHAAHLLMAAALFLAIAQAWLLVALPLFVWAGTQETSPTRAVRRAFPAAYLATLVLFALYLAAAYHDSWSLGAQGSASLDLVSLACSTFSGMGGVMLGFVFPLPTSSLTRYHLLDLLELAALLTPALVGWRVLRSAPQRDRRILLALFFLVTVQIAMVAVARRSEMNGFFWPSKWTAIAHGTAAVLVGFLFDRSLRHTPSPAGAAFSAHFALLTVWLLALLALPPVNDTLSPGLGRTTALLHARARSAEIARLRSDCETLSAHLGQRPLRLPEPDANRLIRAYPLLENYPLAAVRHALPRGLLEIAPGSLSPPLKSALVAVPTLHRLYLDSEP